MELRGKTFSVIGAARSGIAAAKLLKAHGAKVFVSEQAPAETMAHACAELKLLDIRSEFGGNTEQVLQADFVVLSPGVPPDVPVVKQARTRGLKVVSEIEVASWLCKCPIIAITGTNGKTTTTALVGRIFEDAKSPSVVAGNIGLAFSQVVDRMTEEQTAILEVSSFQLDTIETFRPRVSALLNISSDHLDRYEHSMEKYVASKCRIFENQRHGDAIVYNYDDDLVKPNVETRIHSGVKLFPFSTETSLEEGAYLAGGAVVTRIAGQETTIVNVGDISIKGRHNVMNAMAATLIAKAMNIPTASLRATLKNFKGVEHRLEFVRELNGVTYVNDSKATNVASVSYALQSFEKPIVLLLGGRDKGNDYSALAPLVNKYVRAIVAIGESAEKVVSAFGGLKPTGTAVTMEEAVVQATRAAVSGDVVLLSPACASFDWFENYEHRGKVFKELVLKLQ